MLLCCPCPHRCGALQLGWPTRGHNLKENWLAPSESCQFSVAPQLGVEAPPSSVLEHGLAWSCKISMFLNSFYDPGTVLKCFPYIISWKPSDNLMNRYCYQHFAGASKDRYLAKISSPVLMGIRIQTQAFCPPGCCLWFSRTVHVPHSARVLKGEHS